MDCPTRCRRRRRRGAEPGGQRRGVPALAVHAAGAHRRLGGGHHGAGAGPAGPAAARPRARRVHPPGASRRGDRGRQVGRPAWTALHVVDGGADEELSLAGNVEAFRRWRFMPRALTDASAADTTGQVLGRPVPLPLVLAPAGFTRLAHPGGEIAAARSAARHGLPYTLSTAAPTRS